MKRIVKKIVVSLLVMSVCFSNYHFVNNVSAEEIKDTEEKLENYKDTTKAEDILNNGQDVTTMNEDGEVFPLIAATIF